MSKPLELFSQHLRSIDSGVLMSEIRLTTIILTSFFKLRFAQAFDPSAVLLTDNVFRLSSVLLRLNARLSLSLWWRGECQVPVALCVQWPFEIISRLSLAASLLHCVSAIYSPSILVFTEILQE